ncbi:MAG: hypothetical protein ACRD1Z_09565 [Vicinamibacteria bacterium]
MTEGIRRYGPGKFDTILDSYVYILSLDGADTVGDVSEIGIVYSRIEFGSDAVRDIEREIEREKDDPLTDEERELVRGSFGAILTENDQGFVSVDYFETEKAYNSDWKKIEEEVDSMYEDTEEEGEEEGEEEEEEEDEEADEEPVEEEGK